MTPGPLSASWAAWHMSTALARIVGAFPATLQITCTTQTNSFIRHALSGRGLVIVWPALRPGSPRPERPRAPAHGNARDLSKQKRGMEAAVAAAARAAQAAAAAAARWAHVSAGASRVTPVLFTLVMVNWPITLQSGFLPLPSLLLLQETTPRYFKREGVQPGCALESGQLR